MNIWEQFLSWFGAPRISSERIRDISENSPEIIMWAAPVMFFFVALEWYISYRQDRHLYEKKETFGSIFVGVGNVIIAFLMKIALLSLIVLVYNIVPWRMYFSWWMLIPCYIIFDFFSYWAHRTSHQQRFWWATHVVHHSGENYNLTVSFRLSWVQHLKIIFFMPVAFLGFHPVIFFIVNQIAVLFQFWVHTEYIRKMPAIIEYIFATPSNHRVHHGSQEKYINKNYGATFIIWDRMFGTFQEEDEKVIYGVTHNIENKLNPLIINFHEFRDIWNDIRSTSSWKMRFFYLFGDPIAISQEKKLKGAAGHVETLFEKTTEQAPAGHSRSVNNGLPRQVPGEAAQRPMPIVEQAKAGLLETRQIVRK